MVEKSPKKKTSHFALVFDGKGGGHAFSLEMLHQITPETTVWVHLDGKNPESRQWLDKKSELSLPVIDALSSEETRPRFDILDEGALLILRSPNLNPKAAIEDMVSVRLLVTPHRILSITRRPSHSLESIEEDILQGFGPQSVGEFVVTLVKKLSDKMEDILSQLTDALEGMEEKEILHPEDHLFNDVSNLRRKALIFLHHMTKQKNELEDLSKSSLKWLKEPERDLLLEVIEQDGRSLDMLISIRDRTEILSEQIEHRMREKSQHIFYIFSLIAVLFLPLTFLTGLFGSNVGGVPWEGNPQGFYYILGLSFVIALFLLFFFRKVRWL